MQLTGIPVKFSVPWATSAGAGYVNAIPTASQIGVTPGAASLTDGFPPLNDTPLAAGGVPPRIGDVNGILKGITGWLRWLQAGVPATFDAAFQTAIGGYPNGAVVQSATKPGLYWHSTVENNLTDPDAAGAGWTVPTLPDPGPAGLVIKDAAGIGANIKLIGNGVTTPAKFLRAANGILEVLSDNYGTSLMRLDDAGNLTTGAGILGTTVTAVGAVAAGTTVTAGGNVTAGARLRAALGATGSGDANAGAILSDFNGSLLVSGYQKLPNGLLMNWGSGLCPLAQTAAACNYALAFPNAYVKAVASSLSLNSYGGYVETLTTASAIALFASNPGAVVSYVAFGY